MKDEILSVAGVTGILGMIGVAIKWAWDAWFGRLDRRERLIEEAETRLREASEKDVASMRADLALMKAELAELRDVANRQWVVIHMLVAKVDPGDPVLKHAEAVLGKRIFTVSTLPDDIFDLATKFDERKDTE